MELTQWQSRFERWLDENHATHDAAHDISHFRRVWMTAQKSWRTRRSIHWWY